jgi:hypothetical protein
MTVSRVLIVSAVACVVIGAGLLIAGQTMIGSIVLGVGLLDAVLSKGAQRAERQQAEQRSPGGL